MPTTRLLATAAIGGILATLVTARDIPPNLQTFIDNIKNNGQGECQNQLAGGFYSEQDDAKNFAYCGDYFDSTGIVYLQGPNGQFVNMDIDCDGDQSYNDGRCPSGDDLGDTQPTTSFQDEVSQYGIPDLNAFYHTYSVFGNVDNDPSFDPKSYGIQPLSVVAVVCNNQLFYSVWGDENGGDGEPLVGEASIGLASLCFPNDDISGDSGHDVNDVLFIAFSGDDAVPGDQAAWTAQSATDFEASLGSVGDKLINKIGA